MDPTGKKKEIKREKSVDSDVNIGYRTITRRDSTKLNLTPLVTEVYYLFSNFGNNIKIHVYFIGVFLLNLVIINHNFFCYEL